MTSPYRNELDALRERKENLEREIAKLREQTSTLEGLRSHEEALARELSAVDSRIAQAHPQAHLQGGARRTLPLLDQVKIASPCNASWDEMRGDDRVRFCLSCEKNVYNLSAMASEEAERLLAERLGKDLCVRYYQRPDGTILTEDCPVGVKKRRRKKVALAIAAAGATAFAATQLMVERCQMRQGGAIPTTVDVQTPPERAQMGEPMPTPPVMGSMAPPTPAPPRVHPEPKGSAGVKTGKLKPVAR